MRGDRVARGAARFALPAILALGALASPASATIPGENGPIAFTRSVSSGVGGIWSFDRNSLNLETSIVDLPEVVDPAWCTDRLVYSRTLQTPSVGQILESDPAGIGSAANLGEARESSCTADGQGALLSSDAFGTNDIFRVGLGGLPQRLTTDPGFDLTPDPSPDGTRIAFASSRSGDPDYEIFVMGANGADQRPLTANDVNDQDPSWSPDGSRIAFSSDRSPTQVWVMNADGSDPHALANGDQPSWSPDGAKIAYHSAAGGERVWIMNADGSAQEGLTAGTSRFGVSSDSAPSWRPVRPVPVVGGFAPSTPGAAVTGSAGLRIRIAGSRFILGTVVTWNGADLPTTFVSGAELAADVPAALLAAEGSASVAARTPAPGGGTATGRLAFAIRSAGTTGRLTLAPAKLRGSWRQSRFVRGRLVITGESSRPARLVVQVRQGRRLLASRGFAALTGPFRSTLGLPARTLPGALRITVREPKRPAGEPELPAATASVTVTAPPEGIASAAWIATSAGGPVRARLRGQPRFLVANFRLAALPAKGRRLSVTWRLGSFAARIPVQRPGTRLLTSQFGSLGQGRIAAGDWTATLTSGGTRVAVARVKVV